MILSPQGSNEYSQGTPSSGCLFVTIFYVDGNNLKIPPKDWGKARADGVDYVELSNDAGTIRVSGHSLYWLYPEGDAWVIGAGSIGYTNPLGETIVGVGNHKYRVIDYLPDLSHDSVKLGHWWPNKERPPHG